MRQFAVLVVLLSALATLRADDPSPEPPSGDRGRLQGTWKLVKIRVVGTDGPVKAEIPGGLTLVVKKSTMRMTGPGNDNTDNFKLGSSGKLKHIDLTNKGKTIKGIYKLERDQLTLATPVKETAPRPSGFDGKSLMVMVFKKEKK